MINKKRINKIMSITLTMSLLVSLLIPGPARAEPTAGTEPTPVSEIKRKLMIDYLGYTAQPAATDQSPAGLTSVWAEDAYLRTNQLIWIGVAVDKIHDLDLFTQGIFNLEIGFDYDSNYIEPYTTADKSWEQALREINFRQDALYTDNNYWNSTNYTLEKVLTSVDIVTDVDREDIEKATAHKAADWKMCYVQIAPLNRDSLLNTERRFFNTTDEGKQYLIKMPFRLKKVPDNGEHPIVLNLTRGPTTFVIGSDEFGTMPYAAWEKTVQHDPEDDSHNLKTMFRFGGDVDLFSEYLPSITDITAFQGNPPDDEEAEQYNLYHDVTLDDYGFSDGRKDYYIEVPNTTDSIVVKVTGAFPGVTHNGNEIFVESDGMADDKFRTEQIKLIAFNPDEDIGADAYEKNIIKVTYGDDVIYTLHVKRLPAEPDPDDQDIGLKVTKGDPEEDLTLTTDDYTTPKDFVVDDTSEENPNEYWVRVDKDTDTVKIHVTTGSGYTVTIDDEDAALIDGTATREITDLKPVIETNEDGTLKKDDDGNVIINGTTDVVVTVTNASGTKTYTVHIQRLGEGGGIDFKPGNSPYGLTDRMHKRYHGEAGSWTKEQIAAVKAHLIDTSVDSTVRYMFEDDALPDNANAGIAYRPEAWGSVLYGESGHQASFEPEENMDIDSNALFIYQYEGFKDPGIFEIRDECGDTVNPTDDGVSVTLTAIGIKRFADLNDKSDILDENPIELVKYQAADDSPAEQAKEGFIYNLTTVNGNGNNTIRPDVYELEYTVEKDNVVIATAKRNLVVVARRGDFNMDGGLNDGDAGGMTDWAIELDRSIITTLPLRSANMFFYKSFDVNLDGGVNDGDAGILSDIAQERTDPETLLKMYPTIE